MTRQAENAAVVVWRSPVGLGRYGDPYDTVSEAVLAVFDAEHCDGVQPLYVVELAEDGPRQIDIRDALEEARADARADLMHRRATRAYA